MNGNILVLNADSSSLKFSLYSIRKLLNEKPVCTGIIDGLGHEARFSIKGEARETLADTALGPAYKHEEDLSTLVRRHEERFTADHLTAAPHRVVHGRRA